MKKKFDDLTEVVTRRVNMNFVEEHLVKDVKFVNEKLINSIQEVKQFYTQLNNKKFTQMEYAYRCAGKLEDETMKPLLWITPWYLRRAKN